MRTELYTNLQTPKDHHRFVLESGLELFKCKDATDLQILRNTHVSTELLEMPSEPLTKDKTSDNTNLKRSVLWTLTALPTRCQGCTPSFGQTLPLSPKLICSCYLKALLHY